MRPFHIPEYNTMYCSISQLATRYLGAIVVDKVVYKNNNLEHWSSWYLVPKQWVSHYSLYVELSGKNWAMPPCMYHYFYWMRSLPRRTELQNEMRSLPKRTDLQREQREMRSLPRRMELRREWREMRSLPGMSELWRRWQAWQGGWSSKDILPV